MNDYILKYESDNEWLSHHGILGQRKGVIRSFVGKYYIPKGQSKKDLRDINRLRNKDVTKLTDDELNRLNKRVAKERQLTGKNNQQKKNGKDSSPSKNLVNSAKDLRETLNEINKNAQKNKPLKKQKRIDLSDKSDDEIRRMINRANLEQDYNEIVNTPQTRNGKANVAAALAAVGTLAVVGTQVADFVITAKKLKE